MINLRKRAGGYQKLCCLVLDIAYQVDQDQKQCCLVLVIAYHVEIFDLNINISTYHASIECFLFSI